MPRRIPRHPIFYAALLLISMGASAVQPGVETIGPIKVAVPAAIKAALSDTGYRIGGEGGILAEIWPVKTPVSEKNGSSAALYSDFANGAFYGVITFPNGAGDFRGQKIPAGTYALRYQLLPGDGNHMGVAPNPDFFLLVPVDLDLAPADKIAYPALIKLSSKASGTAHPAAFSLTAAGEKSPGVLANEQGYVVATIPMKLSSGDINVGIIVKGSAEQ